MRVRSIDIENFSDKTRQSDEIHIMEMCNINVIVNISISMIRI